MKILDLFCGCGGFSLGAARAGLSVVGAVDSDPIALRAHARNFPTSRHLNLDLSEIGGRRLLQAFQLERGEIDGIVGGPPCQGFSHMGRRRNGDSRNGLFVSFFRLVREIGPKFFLCENVPGILGENFRSLREEALHQVLRHYAVLGPIKLKASDYGAPTTRTRVFFLGFRKGEFPSMAEDDLRPDRRVARVTVSKALQGLPTKISPTWQEEEQGWRTVRAQNGDAFGKRLRDLVPKGVGDSESLQRLQRERRVSGCLGTVHTPDVVARFDAVEPGGMDDISKAVRLDPEGFCPTLRAGTGSDRGSYQAVRPIHPTQPRAITPREAARLQGFPDWYRFDATKWHSFRQIGNSVSPILAECLLRAIREIAT